jgi:hypothetical protein
LHVPLVLFAKLTHGHVAHLFWDARDVAFLVDIEVF